MSEFKVGDRVRVVNTIDYHAPIVASSGVVTSVDSLGAYIRMFDEKGTKYDYYMMDFRLALAEKHPVIVITTDGVTTTATKRLGKKVLGTAYSKCAPADTFDYDTDVGLALARLCGFEIKFHEEEPQPPKKYTHKVVCVESVTKWWTVGKIYECKDGVLQDDSGLNRDRSICTFPKDIDELNSTWWDTPNGREARFIELVED